MNKKLQNILSIIQQSEKLDAEQKDNLIKAVKDAEKEIEITAFKLERTEKVKKTTAILLEETIEELEQKRKAVEAQNRELEIEASLERIRAIAMSMQKAEGLLDVAEIINTELKTLGFTDIRNTIINIFNDTKEKFLNYDYSDYGVGGISEVDYNSHPSNKKFVNKMRKASKDFIITEFTGNELDEWRKWRIDQGQMPDSKLDQAESLYYYEFSIGVGSIGISTFKTINESQIKILNRFRNVFDLAYRRYTDITLAEAQAREAQIEASLERVRAVAMSMNKSEDLLSICEIFFKEFNKLGFNKLRNSLINIFNDEEESFVNYDYSDYMGGSISNVSYNSNPANDEFLIQIRKANDAFVETVIDRNQLNEWKEFRRSHGEKDDPRLDNINALYYYNYSIGSGSIGISIFNPISEDQLAILKRFRNVFNLAYRRYNDIALAEAQAREAQIELAFERVRARSLAMHKSEELSETAEVLFEQINLLGNIPDRVSIGIINEESKKVELWVTDQGGNQLSHEFFFSLDEPTSIIKIYNAWIEKKDRVIVDLTGQNLQDWLLFVKENATLPIDETQIKGRRVQQAAFFSQGFLLLTTHEQVANEIMDLLVRFAKVFDQTYRRFLDLQKAEAQTRESQIQLGLERVRASSMAMHNSADVGNATAIMFTELEKLGIETIRCGIDIMDKSKVMEVWATTSSDTGKVFQIVGKLDSRIHPHLQRTQEAWERQEKFTSSVLEGQDLKDYYKKLSTAPDYCVPVTKVQTNKQFNYDFFFKEGGLFAYRLKPFTEEQIMILQRFTAVFGLTFRRYLDLKKAEEQTRESQIELALERVRAKTMAMHNSQDVGDTVVTLFDEVLKLGLDQSIRCGIGILEGNEDMETWSATSHPNGEVDLKMGMLDMTIHPMLIGLKKAWKNGEKGYSYKYIGDDVFRYYEALNKEPDYPFQVDLDSLPENEYHKSFFFTEGILFAFAPNPISEEASMVLDRFARVFGQTYRRYLDLQKAEAQARESQIQLALERVRARTMAMQKSDELAEIAYVFYEQFGLLGESPEQLTIGIIDETKKIIEFWLTLGGNQINHVFKAPINEPIVLNKSYFAWKERKKSIVIDISDDELKAYYNFFKKLPGYKEFNEFKNSQAFEERRVINIAFFSRGTLSLAAPEPRPPETIKILERFAQVFDGTYTRFLDLQKAEEQAREAQIEASLEKVRAVAMSMNKSEDLLNICKVSFDEFKKLGFNNIRNALIHIQYDEQKYFMDYDFSDLTGGAITKIEYGSHPVVEDYLQQINSAEDAFYQGVIKEDQLEEWKNFRKNSGQIDDPRLEKATALYYYFFSIGIGDIGISTLQPIEDTQIKILKRFRNVFDLAYRRYNDIALAEEQARETQIQLALERVRAKAMAMHTSNDLSDTMGVLFKELPKLGINSLRCGVDLLSKSTTRGVFYAAATTQESDTFALIGAGDMTNHPEFMKQYKSWLKNENYFMTLRDEELRSYYESISTWLSIPYNPREHKTQTEHGYYFSFSEGMFYAWTERPYSDDEINILNRFKAIIDLTFRRYLDLKKAEAQAREAQIEAALEKVRAVAMGMIKSDDLMNVSKALLKGLNALGFENIRNTQIDILNDDKGSFLNYEYSDYGVSGVTEVFYNSHPHVQQFVKDVHSSSDALSLIIISGSDLDEWRDYRKQANHLPDPKFDEATSLYYYCYSIGMGALGVSSFSQISDEKLEILKRFRNVFGLAYRRYNDIAVAEAQAREAEIEAALERVRSRTMAMQKSDELAETASHLFVQLNSLGIKPYRFNIAIVNPESENCQLWSTTNEGKVIPSGPHIPLKEYTVFNQMYDGWKLQQNVQVIKLLGEERITWTKYIMKYVSFNEYKPENIDLERLRDEPAIFSNFFFKQGFIVVHTIKEIDESDIKIIQRFVNVFEQTYTRFLDLQKAEEQAREAIKQASLDRVRGEIASMRTSEDLNRITPIIWNELKTLEVPFFRCGVFIVDEANENVQVYLTTPEGKSLGVLHLPFNSNELTKNTVEYWRQKQVYKDHWDKKKFLIWMQSMIELGQVKNTETYQGSAVAPESLNLHFVPFAQGMLYVGDIQPLTDEKLELVKILAKAFSIAYARYEDFKNLEAAKNKIEITLDELRSAQTQLIHAEKMASLGELTAGIAHEIKNPLNFVNNFSEVSRELLDEMQIEIKNNNIEEVIDLVEDLKQNLEKINQHGKRADSIVKGMLLHSRGTTGEKTLTDINDLLDQYVNLAYHGMRAQNKEFNITIEKDYDETLDKINIVPQDISRVFLNIINNACYAAYDRKKKGANNFSPTLKVSTKKLNDKVEILIGDNGNGIPADYLDKIFQPFFTTKPSGEGTGLGLSLSYDIVTKVHGGELKVETKEAEGTTFIIQLPSH